VLGEAEKEEVRRLKREIMDALLQNGTDGTTAPAGWDGTRADAALAACVARLDRGLREQTGTPARRNVVELTRKIITRHHSERDPLLWTDLAGLEAMFGRWRAANAGVAPPDEGDWWEWAEVCA
jgi:hypothetical protein